jgi:hypothetical protein
MTCDVLSFNSKKKSNFFSYWRSVENVPSKKYSNAVDHVHLWKMLYFEGRHKYPQFIMGEEPFLNIEISCSQLSPPRYN